MTDEPETEAADHAATRPAHSSVPTDHLTGLASHQALRELGPSLLVDNEAAGHLSALLVLDIDDFKLVNDTLGHAAGDTVLVTIAHRLRQCLRDVDLVCRVGGDEFAVLATGLAHEDDATAVADKLLMALAPEIAVEDVRMHVEVSVGVAVSGSDGDTLEDLLRAADRAMYDAKAAGSGQARRPAASPRTRGRRIAPTELTTALDTGALALHHQPQFDSTTGQAVATAASLRWDHPDLGLVRSPELLSLAEQAGLLGLLDRSVVSLAVRDLAQLHAASPGVRVSVDVSPRALLGRGLVDHVSRCLAEQGVPAGQLTLEVAEPASAYARSTAQVLGEIEQLGCRLSVHDFGLARASLTVLARFSQIREVKIAPMLVRTLPDQSAAERTVRAVVAAAHALGVLVVAEGVASAADAERLRGLGCDVLQGDHLSPELTLPEVVALLEGSGTASR